MATLAVYSGASAVDGHVASGGTYLAFSLKRAEPGYTPDCDYTGGYTQVMFESSGSPGDDVYGNWKHSVFLFDVAAVVLPGTVISSATFTFTAYNTPTDTYSSSLVLTNAPVAAYTSLTGADYQSMIAGAVEHGTARIDLADLVADSVYSFTLNATALATLNSTILSSNVFELGVMNSLIFDNTEPTHLGAFVNDAQIYSVNWGTPSFRPYLTITYKIGGGFATLKVTGTKASAGDTLDADLFAVEVFTK